MKCLQESLQKRDSSAWDEVYEGHARELYGFAFRLVRGDPQTAADLFQEIWLQAISQIGQFDATRGEFRPWLFGIARRRIAFNWRQRLARGEAATEREELCVETLGGRDSAGRRSGTFGTSGRRASVATGARRPSGGRC